MDEAPRQREDGSDDESPAADVERTLAEGRSAATPFVLLGSVAFVVWGAAALVALVALLVWWLV
jgi:hypothetical protein